MKWQALRVTAAEVLTAKTERAHIDLHLLVEAVAEDERVRHAHAVRLHRVVRAVIHLCQITWSATLAQGHGLAATKVAKDGTAVCYMHTWTG